MLLHKIVSSIAFNIIFIYCLPLLLSLNENNSYFYEFFSSFSSYKVKFICHKIFITNGIVIVKTVFTEKSHFIIYNKNFMFFFYF